ncbi:glutamine--fructose-6-phosphate transaminase (isomerizing) [Slackia exigua]|uniref:Glutamine--fructose-6-phosphate aminotransferase [isomerizing] n=1 Tax=Slackia exigua (strain ATCC 700122 / DSM 15923 / CIP 105133 / JCM 11022 / KCTC 5966 / S-7) TaxID=649764 RepID=D0WH26_SLAES|nr:glutamine--fructose-6-phosphate transaminase (isomerizing) [Slackia exigua]EEZ61213.1 glutamine-fructose-6-phosphate transaminase (isomerizing) [Slackia exigua ATCC 700122]STN99502.1 Glucosamine--fructose-6-phosphate aminotransferase [isomerizing] [Slackia exigua]
MCGIVGYTGTSQATDILIDGLKRMEYRGYDSAGIAVQTDAGLVVRRKVGKVSGLEAIVASEHIEGTCGIGHTRWATHGRPSERNAHPHTDCSGRFAVVHNGIIENFAALKEELAGRGHEFRSDTDTEVIAHLIEEAYEGDLLDAVRMATRRLVGAYGLAVTCTFEPGVIVAARKDSPVIIGAGETGAIVASDIVAIVDETRDAVVLENDTFARMACVDGGVSISYRDFDGEAIEPEVMHVDWDISAAERGGYPDFMMKEIFEQPRTIRDTLAGRMVNGHLKFDELTLNFEELAAIDRVYIIACGTSYHAGLVAKNLIEGWSRIPCEVEVASEFRYRNPIVTPSTLVVAVSQSGETADTLAAIRDARIRGAKVFGITNVVGSPIARESDGVIYIKANKEIAVAATKSFLGQVVALTLLSMLLGQVRGLLTTKQIRMLFRELADTALQVEEILSDLAPIDEAAEACKDATSALFVGRGIGATICYEGALKLKEVSYLHAEAYAAGEMKHGPIALLDEGFPVIAVATQSPTYDKVVSNIQECKARGARIVVVATEGDEDIKEHADYVIYVPKVRDCFSAVTVSVPLQLFARAIAIKRGCDVDQPRNLAKSVTVE